MGQDNLLQTLGFFGFYAVGCQLVVGLRNEPFDSLAFGKIRIFHKKLFEADRGCSVILHSVEEHSGFIGFDSHFVAELLDDDVALVNPVALGVFVDK